ncbi:hypothetical protein [Alteribacillus sp. HJP-4]|uniref:hypothetical protein n=1 Tax=Alteribacillus sp. HJP-4 TaxID=2775394 RepID=UPI0035CD13BD
MNQLIASEFERIWEMKIVKGFFVLFLVITGFCIYFLTLFDNGQFTRDSHTALNAVNFPWFLLREVSFFVVLLFMPFLYVVVFNGEIHSKAYYLILYRPYQRAQFLMSKWSTLALTAFFVTLIIFLAGIAAGIMLYPMPEYIELYNDPTKYSLFSGYLYTIKYFGLFFVVLLSGMALSTVISLIAPNPVIAFFSILIAFIVPIYFSADFLYLLLPSQSIFIALSESGWPDLYSIVPLILAGGGMVSFFIWRHMDFK